MISESIFSIEKYPNGADIILLGDASHIFSLSSTNQIQWDLINTIKKTR